MIRIFFISTIAFAIIGVAFAINIGLGILVAILAYGVVDALSRPD